VSLEFWSLLLLTTHDSRLTTDQSSTVAIDSGRSNPRICFDWCPGAWCSGAPFISPAAKEKFSRRKQKTRMAEMDFSVILILFFIIFPFVKNFENKFNLKLHNK
jgi:hypothetical protein